MLHLFGDESCFDTAVVYAVVCVPSDRQAQVESAFAYVKECFGGSPASRVHCRELFAGSQRAKGPWAHLKYSELFELCAMTGNKLRLYGAKFRVGFIDDQPSGRTFKWRGALAPFPAGSKQLIPMAQLVALIDLQRRFGPENLKFWKDPDTTKIQWGNQRKQAGAIPFNLEGGQPLPVEPISGEKPVLLDVADILAYVASHSLCGADVRDKESFRHAYNAFTPELVRMEFHPQVFEDSAEKGG